MEASLDIKRAPTPDPSDGKARIAFGPRLKSYLSSNNLLNLGSSPGSERRPEVDIEWPGLVPTFDETTVSTGAKSQKWIHALRYRLWHHDDLHLDAAYNAPIRWLTDEYFKVSKRKDQLEEQLLVLEQENQDLRSKFACQLRSSHRASRSFSSGQPLQDASFVFPKRQHSNSTPTISESGPINRMCQQGGIQTIDIGVENVFVPTVSRHLKCASSFSSSGRSGGGSADIPSDEDEEFISRQNAAVDLARFVADQTAIDFRTYYPEIARILRVPMKGPFGTHAISNPTNTTSEVEENMTLTESTSNVIGDNSNYAKPAEIHTLQHRAFSFYPGDDDVLESFKRYSVQQPPVQTSQTTTGLRFRRKHSQTSVKTVIPVSKSKDEDGKAVSRSSPKTCISIESRASSREDKAISKPQGPVAAAIAATTRFGKSGRKTLRKVA